jgi:predicted AAA+ superfamily ATPase
MRFIAGPRQVGKTTLVKKFLESKQLEKLYFNWDLREIRDKFKNDPYFFETPLYDSKPPTGLPWVCHDEIHKMPKWKILSPYLI